MTAQGKLIHAEIHPSMVGLARMSWIKDLCNIKSHLRKFSSCALRGVNHSLKKRISFRTIGYEISTETVDLSELWVSGMQAFVENW